MSKPRTLREDRDHWKLQHECSEGVLSMTVARVGGSVEGNPTGRHNFLQRIDALCEIEREHKKLTRKLARKGKTG